MWMEKEWKEWPAFCSRAFRAFRCWNASSICRRRQGSTSSRWTHGAECGHRQGGHPMHRCGKGVRIGGGIGTIQLSLIGQVAGIQSAALRLPETQMAGGVARSVEAEYLPAAQLEAIPIFQKPSSSVLIDLVNVRIKTGREGGSAVGQILQYGLTG